MKKQYEVVLTKEEQVQVAQRIFVKTGTENSL